MASLGLSYFQAQWNQKRLLSDDVIEKIKYFSKESGFYELKPEIWKMKLFILQITH